jgi:hypothetical protein
VHERVQLENCLQWFLLIDNLAIQPCQPFLANSLFQFAFPDGYNVPSASLKRVDIFCITPPIPLQFRLLVVDS